ncbi:MAG: radical SAM family heme chaperone HemW [Myxococcota bacterium]|nr:radical SAM family heme chaperone HemW [Myxococcota bacterium]
MIDPQLEPRTFGIYLHLPFCRSRCLYCDFFSTQVEEVPAAKYAAAVHREWQARRSAFEGLACQSVYIGGGTPSLWNAQDLRALLAPFVALGALEVTIEANPADVDAAWFEELATLGVTRFSIGVQSLDDERLKLLGRRHDAASALLALEQAKSSGAETSADLIYATPGSSSEGIAAEVDRLAGQGVDHVSAYELTLSKGTTLARLVETGQLEALDENETLAQWHAVEQGLGRHGLLRYEVSNFARPGRQCRHNALYWRGGLYAGLGAGAHGHLRKGEAWIRYANGTDIDRYLVNAAGSAFAPLEGGQAEVVEAAQRAIELVMLGLRTVEGVHWPLVRACLTEAKAGEFLRVAARIVGNGYAQWRGDHLAPTPCGMLMADELASWF